MKMRRPAGIKALGLLLALGLAVGIGGGATYAAFFDTATNPGNDFDAADDLRPPEITATVIEGGGGVAGLIRAGGSYRAYANVTDLGSPPSGIATVAADLSNLTSGANSVNLTNGGGPWVVGGTTYHWRTAAQTANGGLSAGSHSYSFTLTDNAGNSGNDGGYTVTVDNSGPTITATVIQKNEGGVVGYIRQAGVYRVYANLSDAAGIGTVTADLTNVTTGAASVSLTTTGGPFTVGGVTYTYRSGTTTANNPLAAGTKSYSITADDGLGNSSTSNTGSVIVDNTVPAGSDFQTSNASGGTAGLPEAGDTATFSFNEPMEPISFLAGWDGTSTTVTARFVQNANNDRLQIWNSANTAQLPFGFVSLGGNYLNGATRNFTGSSMVMSGNTITITLGNPSASMNTVGASTPVWNPSNQARDRAWNQMSTTAVTQVGAPKVNF